MLRQRFDTLHTSIRFSVQPAERPENMQGEDYHWMRVDGFVNAFNKQRELFIEPLSELRAVKSISRWYGQGGNWINLGLPQYVAINRKPENGCEIQSSAGAQSGSCYTLSL
jgi:hypothetical protein